MPRARLPGTPFCCQNRRHLDNDKVNHSLRLTPDAYVFCQCFLSTVHLRRSSIDNGQLILCIWRRLPAGKRRRLLRWAPSSLGTRPSSIPSSGEQQTRGEQQVPHLQVPHLLHRPQLQYLHHLLHPRVRVSGGRCAASPLKACWLTSSCGKKKKSRICALLSAKATRS